LNDRNCSATVRHPFDQGVPPAVDRMGDAQARVDAEADQKARKIEPRAARL
jgi:hypothetical protein